MRIQQLLIEFVVVFAVTFLVSVLVTFLYSLIVHGAGVVDWEISIRNGILLGVVFPLSGAVMKRRK